MPHMPDIIANGEYSAQNPHKARKDEASQFHYYRKTVETSEGPKEAIVDVIVRAAAQPKESVYSLTHENAPGYQKKLEKLGKDKAAIAMSSGPFLITSNNGFEDNLSPQCEVVNIRFE